MELNSFIPLITTLLTGGGLGVFLTFKLGNRKQNQSELEKVIDTYREQRLEDSAVIKELRARIDELERITNKRDLEVSTLRNQLMIFESSHVDIPLPMWLKDINGTMLFLNKEFEYAYLKPKGKTIHEYIGKNDFAIFSKEEAEQYRAHDAEVMRKRKAIRFNETVEINGQVIKLTTIKYPRFLNNTIIGIGGIVLSEKQD